jgi:Tfp pilus assembly protein PilF/TolB-like protein
LRRLIIPYSALLVCLLALATFAPAQVPTPGAHTLLVLPFDNASDAPGLQWISEAFPEVIGQRLSSSSIYTISRDDRLYAFDRMGIPTAIHPSRATLYRIAEQMDADYVVLGDYTFDGQTFRARAQVLDMKNLRLSGDQLASGPLVSLIDIQREIAWQVLHQIQPQSTMTRQDFLRDAPPIRLDAFENYMRGVLATDRTEKIKYFKETLRLNPQYTVATLSLAKAYFAGREYEQAANWFSKIPKTDPSANEANFMLGLSAYYIGEFDRAEQAFRFTESRLPLIEIYNNLGVVSSRRGRKSAAVEYFQKAVQADPSDPDYHFNLAVALYRNGETANAARQLRDTISRRPSDSEARSLLDTITLNPIRLTDSAPPQPRIPLERIKRNYDETSYRQLAIEITNAMEESLAKTDPHTHATFHIERGRDLLNQGLTADAEKEYREAIMREPTNAAGHAGLARVAEVRNDPVRARSEAQASLRLQPNVDAYLVLARLNMNDNKLDAAADDVDKALALQPANADALSTKRTIAARRAGQTQPVP